MGVRHTEMHKNVKIIFISGQKKDRSSCLLVVLFLETYNLSRMGSAHFSVKSPIVAVFGFVGQKVWVTAVSFRRWSRKALVQDTEEQAVFQ